MFRLERGPEFPPHPSLAVTHRDMVEVPYRVRQVNRLWRVQSDPAGAPTLVIHQVSILRTAKS